MYICTEAKYSCGLKFGFYIADSNRPVSNSGTVMHWQSGRQGLEPEEALYAALNLNFQQQNYQLMAVQDVVWWNGLKAYKNMVQISNIPLQISNIPLSYIMCPMQSGQLANNSRLLYLGDKVTKIKNQCISHMTM